MRREAFGPLAALKDGDLARALVAIAAGSFRLPAAPSLDALLEHYPRQFRWRERRHGERLLDFTVPVVALQRYAMRASRRRSAAEALAQWQVLFPAAPPPTRYCLDLDGLRNDADRQLDLDWLAALFSHPGLAPAGVFYAWPGEALSLEWEWPLRIGVAPGPSAGAMRKAVERCAHRELLVLVDVGMADARCDLLLFASGLREAMRSAPDLPTVRASAVLVPGGLEVPWTQAQPWITGLRRQFHAGAIAVCSLPSAERGAWFQGLVAELAHDTTLDCALFLASEPATRRAQAWNHPEAGSRFERLTPPLILADRDFLDRAHVAETARRIAQATAGAAGRAVSLPPGWASEAGVLGPASLSLRQAGQVVASLAETRRWHQESTDATALRQFRGAVEAATGAALVLPRIVVGAAARGRPPAMARSLRDGARDAADAEPATAGAEPPAEVVVPPPPAPRREQRRVQLDVLRAADHRRVSTVAPASAYSTAVFIGAGRQGSVRADAVLDESLLPASRSGHEIRVVFTPLWKDADGGRPAAQVQPVHLPASGNSTTALFHFTTPADLADLRARLVLLHGYRVLQTLLLHCRPQAGRAGGKLSLSEENVVSPDYGDASVAPPFEAALVVNDSAQGVTGLTAIAGSGAQFFEPAGFDKLLQAIREDLGALNAPEETPDEVITGLDDERVHDLIYRLALRGAALAKELKRQPHLGAFIDAPRLQVVDAVSGAFFPIELVYDGKAPAPGARRCEFSIDALERQAVHDACPNRASADHLCPAAFWGFSKCIERQPSNGQQGYGFAQPGPGRSALRPLRQVLFAASRRVRSVDLAPPAGLESVFTAAGLGCGRAQDWSDWTTKVGSETPSMLVLLPHSLNSAAAADLPALEIGGTEMPSVRMDESFVHGAGDERPVVLLLGCSTALPDIPFLSFVREFRFNGAAVTVGTLATIRGRQTVEFVREFLVQLRRVAEEGLTFDEAILRVKRRMLARGDPFVLSLVAYGDTGWRVSI